MCDKCYAAYDREWHNKRRDAAAAKYDEWITLIAEIPTPYKTLTESEWLEACKHFGGCAYCGSDNVDARAMFIKFKDGGRYCAWNIVPMCEKCAKVHNSIDNPFVSMDSSVNRDRGSMARVYNHSLDKLQKIVDYLLYKMEV